MLTKEQVLARREEVVAEHKVLERVQGSGWHKADAAMAAALQKGETPLSDRPVAVWDGDESHAFAGPCCDKVREIAKEFLDGHTASPDDDPETLNACAAAQEVAAFRGDFLVLSRKKFNGLMLAAARVNAQVVGTGLR